MIDASAVAAWLVPAQRTSSSEALLDEAHTHQLEAPHIFPAEVRNMLLALERRGRSDRSLSDQAIATLSSYAIAIEAPPSAREYDFVLDLARREGLSVYDALYLSLALGERLTLATRDMELIAAAARNGLPIRDLRS